MTLRAGTWIAAAVAILGAVPLLAQPAAPTPFPLHASLAGWTPTAEERHSEYLRVTLHRGQQTTGLEIVPSKVAACEWCSRRFRLQPAPGQQPPEALLLAALQQLRRFDDAGTGAPFAAPPQPEKTMWKGQVPRAHTVAAWQLALERLAAAAYATFAGLLVALAVVGVRRNRWNGVALAGGAGIAALAAWWPELRAPAPTLLHEGTTRHVVAALHGQVDHAGPGHLALVHWLAGDAPLKLAGAWTLNGALHGINAGLAFALARAVSGRWGPAVVAAAVLLANPWLRIVAGSELAAGSTTTLLLGALAGLATVADRTRASRALDAAALALIAAATVLLGLTRVEWAGMGLAVFGLAAARVRWGAVGLHERMQAAWLHWRARPAWQRWTVVALAAATVPLAFHGGYPAWAWAAVNPLTPTILTAPLWLLAVLSPVAVVLAGVGIVFAWRRSAEAVVLLVALAGVYKLYFGASHRVYFEMARYSAMLLPLVALLAAAGWWALDRGAQGWPRRRRWIAAAAVVAGIALPPFDRFTDRVWDWQPDRAPRPGQPLRRDLQRELGFFLRAVQDHPTCALATRTTREQERVDTPRTYDYLFFGVPLAHPELVPADRPLLQAAETAVPTAPCLLFARGLDCNLVHGRTCDGEVAGLPVVARETFASLPYSDPVEYGRVRPQVTLDLVRVWQRLARH